MANITLGRTGITVEQNGFGALPIQRVDFDTAGRLLNRALDGGMNLIDTARAYSDSEEKIGRAIAHRRDQYTLATKTGATTPEGFWRDLETSLRLLKTDHIDIYQFHCAARCYQPEDGTGLYECMLKAQQQGKILHIAATAHKVGVAEEIVDSGLYECLQFPFSYLSGERDLALAQRCRQHNVGFIAMKGLSGGLITNSRAACAFMAQYDNVAPIWGVQRDWELEEFLSYIPTPPPMYADIRALIAHDRQELAGDFCRGCGYCMPCPQGIEINNCARMSQMIRRAPSAAWLTPEWQHKMQLITTCLHCGKCMKSCPYGLNIPELLQKNWADYQRILAGEQSV